ncbi:methylated-DNA--[protein]-cysteine S-methyltransferase [Xenophilus arseniciresistens]|uniref:Methylated-DNA--[protein]-cysteine S-methyltransferase n=1 Tax=Xenophilus arseniciresistens TaxID=1283306 RepID=A0AAE3NDG3_9BURK|nr:methylated-DNA--[protein]-cysteine S-methyltransferase [Xenophilus arseniciresistens]MDA7417599.1 methylated-DNA--[protein]-cysteine S-methyltransferase [Xenophilus arseniciresistens]
MNDAVNPCATAAGWAVFATAVGHCGLAWGPRGLRCVRLPEADGSAQRLRSRFAREFASLPECEPAAWPTAVASAVEGVQALLAGEPRDLREIVLDPGGLSDFQLRLYTTARAIAPGQVRTYGDIAEELGDKTLARAVGQALGANPFAPVVPCHRVMGARGWQGGFSAPGGVALKLRMLAIEGAQPGGQAQLF